MSLRYKGGVISATAPTTSTQSAGGVWTLQQQAQAIAGSGWPSPPDGNLVFFGGYSDNDSKLYIARSSSGTSFSLVDTGYTTSQYAQMSGIAYSEALGKGVAVLTNNETTAYKIVTFNSSGTVTQDVGTVSNFFPAIVANTGPNNCFYKDGFFYIVGSYNSTSRGLVVLASSNGTSWTNYDLLTTIDSPSNSRNRNYAFTKTDDNNFIVLKMTGSNAMRIYYGTSLSSMSFVTISSVMASGTTFIGGVAGKAGSYAIGLGNNADSYAGATLNSSNLTTWTRNNDRTIFISDGCFNTDYYPTLDLFYFYGGAEQAVYSSSNGSTLTNLTGSSYGYAFSGTYSAAFNKIFKANYNGSGEIESGAPSSSMWTRVLAPNNYTWGVACSSKKG